MVAAAVGGLYFYADAGCDGIEYRAATDGGGFAAVAAEYAVGGDLTLALFMPMSGYLTDRYGTKKVFSVSMALFVLGSLMCAAAPNLPLLVFARVVQGMGGAMMVPVPRLIILRAYDKAELINRMNFVVMPALLGPIAGPLVGGYLVEYASWHWVFLINVPIGLAGIVWAAKIMPDFSAPEGSVPHFDLTGFLLFGAAAVGLSLSVELLMHPGARLFSALCGTGGLAALWCYWRHARHDGDLALYPPRLRLVRTFRFQPFGHGGDAVFDALAASGGLYAQCECIGTDARARGVGRFADQAVCETVDCPFRLPQGADLEYPHYRVADYVYGFAGCVYAGLADCAGSVCARYVQFAAIFVDEYADSGRFAAADGRQRQQPDGGKPTVGHQFRHCVGRAAA